MLLRVLGETGKVTCRPKYEGAQNEVRYRLIKKRNYHAPLFFPRLGFHSLNTSTSFLEGCIQPVISL
jgi:hypothetical protein